MNESDQNNSDAQQGLGQLIAIIDQGTSSSRVIVFSISDGKQVVQHQIPIRPTYPNPGWVEMDPEQIYSTTLECLNVCMKKINELGGGIKNILGLGITNQRETTIVWDRETGKPLAPAIVWSDSRTYQLVNHYIKLTDSKKSNAFQEITGLPIHSYFSALKIRWLLNEVPPVADANRRGKLMAGTVDSWIIWRLTNGRKHVTDVTNASRTLLFNIKTLKWDNDLCQFFDINPSILPQVISSSEICGVVQDAQCLMSGVQIAGVLGDQQASLVAQTWTTDQHSGQSTKSNEPTIKVTYGTGAFMLWNIGNTMLYSDKGILTTIAYKMGPKEQTHYALEGAISFAGATINWLQSKLELFKDHDECNRLAMAILEHQPPNTSDSCYLVPAFSGLFCPWWQESARAILTGLTANTTRGDLICAGIRSSAYQTYDVIRVATFAQSRHASSSSSSSKSFELKQPEEILVDGGMTWSPVLMQSLADIANVTVRRRNHSEVMTALGAAVAVALALGIDPSGLLKLRLFPADTDPNLFTFHPKITSDSRRVMLNGWHASIERSLNWIPNENECLAEDSLIKLMKFVSGNEEEGSELAYPRVTSTIHKKTRLERFGFASLVALPLVTVLGLLTGYLMGRRT